MNGDDNNQRRFLMNFPVGSTVIHANHGLGEIVRIEDAPINGSRERCYVVKIRDLMVWVPITNGAGKSSLRIPTPEKEFNKLIKILSSPSEPLPEDRKKRKTHLIEQLTDGSAHSLCRLIRDLSSYSHKKRLSEEDKSIFQRAQNTLLTEWAFSLSEPLPQARKRMGELLRST